MATKTYDPGKVIVTFKGQLISGFADGTFISAERAGDAFTKTVGSGGEVARSRNRDKSGTVTLTLMETASGNAILAAFANQDELLGTGQGVLFIKDLSGNELISGNAWIQKRPTMEKGKEVSNREWTFAVESLELFEGGAS
jgi:hypothetical protein